MREIRKLLRDIFAGISVQSEPKFISQMVSVFQSRVPQSAMPNGETATFQRVWDDISFSSHLEILVDTVNQVHHFLLCSEATLF